MEAIDFAILFQKGDKKGFEYFYNKYYPSLKLFAYNKYLKDLYSANDIVQESFVSVWAKREQFNNHMVIRGYLYETVKNGCLNYLKKQGRTSYEPFDAQDDSLRDKIRAETYEILHAAVSTLPEKCRHIVILYYVGNMNSRQISESMGLSPSTIKNQLVRGLKLLRKKYDVTDAEAIANSEILIRKIYNSTGQPKGVARLYGVDPNTVLDIKSGRIWKKVTASLRLNNTP